MVRVELLREDGREIVFRVDIEEDKSATHHEISMSRADLTRLSRPGEQPVQLIERCFAFLLERESKESILRRFDVSVISRYFPEFDRTIRST